MSKPRFTLGILASLISFCLGVSVRAQTKETKPETATISGLVTSDIDITVPDPKKPYNVYGRVVDADTGKPVQAPGFEIRALTQDGKPTGGGSAFREGSKPNGEFHLRVVAPGKYLLLVDADGSGDSEFIGEPTTFDVSEGDTTGVEVKVRQGGSISGVIVIEGTSDPKILSKLSQVNFYTNGVPAKPGMPIYVSNIKINADGSFHIRGLPQSRVIIYLNRSPDTRGPSGRSGR